MINLTEITSPITAWYNDLIGSTFCLGGLGADTNREVEFHAELRVTKLKRDDVIKQFKA